MKARSAMNASILNLIEKTPIHSETSQPSVEAEAPMLEPASRSLVVIDSRTLSRECFAQGVMAHKIDMDVSTHGSIDAWLAQRGGNTPASAVIVNIGGRRTSEPAFVEDVKTSRGPGIAGAGHRRRRR